MPDQIAMVEVTMKTIRNLNETWNVNIWTNNRTLLPRTAEWAKGLDIEIRELSELPSFSNYSELFNQIVNEDVVKASDLARFLVLHDLGGLYLDFDQILFEYDERLNPSFDFVTYLTDEFSFGYLIAETSFIMSKPNHPITIEYLK